MLPVSIVYKQHVKQIVFWEHQAQETLVIMSQVSEKDADNYFKRSDAVIATLRSYYTENGALSYNLDEALKALLTLITRSMRDCIANWHKKISDLSKTLLLCPYVDLNDDIPQKSMKQPSPSMGNHIQGSS